MSHNGAGIASFAAGSAARSAEPPNARLTPRGVVYATEAVREGPHGNDGRPPGIATASDLPEEGSADGRPAPEPRSPVRARSPADRRLLPNHPRLRGPAGGPWSRRVLARPRLGQRSRPRAV